MTLVFVEHKKKVSIFAAEGHTWDPTWVRHGAQVEKEIGQRKRDLKLWLDFRENLLKLRKKNPGKKKQSYGFGMFWMCSNLLAKHVQNGPNLWGVL